MSQTQAKSTIKADSAHTTETCPADSGAPEAVLKELSSALAPVKQDAVPRIGADDLYLSLVPSGSASGTMVNQVKRTVYYKSGDQALYAIKETYLLKIEWVNIFIRHNMTSSPETHQVRALTRLTVANGKEASTELGLSASFKGLGVSFGTSTTTFSSTETTEEREFTTTYTVNPGESLYVYQRQYTFNDRIWWILDAWNELWTVGANQTYATVTANIKVTISADEQISSNQPLTGQKSVNVTAGAKPENENWQIRRQFTNITQKAKDSINSTLASANTPVH